MRKVRAFLPLMLCLGIFVLVPQIARADTLPDSESITDITPTDTPTPDVTATDTPLPTDTPTATPDALPSTGASANLFFVLLFVLLLSGGTYFITSSRRS